MYGVCGSGCVGILWLFSLSVLAWAVPVRSAWGQGATRDLPDQYAPGVTFTVSITINPPPETAVAGFEDGPPAGWSVSAISDAGTWDAQQTKVKWGPLGEPPLTPIPARVTYDVTPSGATTSDPCFVGNAFLDTSGDERIDGDQCIAVVVPTISEWGLLVMGLLVLTAGTLVITRRRRDNCAHDGQPH